MEWETGTDEGGVILPLSPCLSHSASLAVAVKKAWVWAQLFTLKGHFFPMWSAGDEAGADGCVRPQMGFVLIMESLLLWETEGGGAANCVCLYKTCTLTPKCRVIPWTGLIRTLTLTNSTLLLLPILSAPTGITSVYKILSRGDEVFDSRSMTSGFIHIFLFNPFIVLSTSLSTVFGFQQMESWRQMDWLDFNPVFFVCFLYFCRNYKSYCFNCKHDCVLAHLIVRLVCCCRWLWCHFIVNGLHQYHMGLRRASLLPLRVSELMFVLFCRRGAWAHIKTKNLVLVVLNVCLT